MSIKRRVERLEEDQGPAAVDLSEAPQIVITWPEDETPEIRAANREARQWYTERGLDWRKNDLVVSWADGSEVTPP